MLRDGQTFLEVLKSNKEKKEKELKVLNKAIEIVSQNKEWEIIMQAQSII